MKLTGFILTILILLLISPAYAGDSYATGETRKIIAFYYPWYGNPGTDGQYIHWNHNVLGVDYEKQYAGGDDIGANFYPQLGCYSCNDHDTIRTHMQWMCDAGIDIISVSWWGIDTFEDKTTPLLLDCANEFGLKVCFHIEPFDGRNASTTKQSIAYLIDKYGNHPAFYREESMGNRPMFFIYDSYQVSPDEWSQILSPGGVDTIRGTKYDSILIALWVNPHEEDSMLQTGFDGFYSYFAADNCHYGSSPSNWDSLQKWASANSMIFIPCVGPGYLDTRIRPWNTSTTRDRGDGKYYDRMFVSAIKAKTRFIGITSFNEWHEGTQIEPAIPKSVGDYVYEDYRPLDPDYYLERTKFWSDAWKIDFPIDDVIRDEKIRVAKIEPLHHKAYGKTITFADKPSVKYDGGSDSALVDGIKGNENYQDGRWVGFEGYDLDATIDLREEMDISSVSMNFLSDQNAWIFYPIEIKIEILDKDRNKLVSHNVDMPPVKPIESVSIYKMSESFSVTGRYVHVVVKNVGVCPDWHKGAGGKAWLFVDEVVLE
jgi:hypothetical protein